MCEEMHIFIDNQGYEKLSNRSAKNKSNNIKCWGGYRGPRTSVYIYDGCKTGTTTPIIMFCKKFLYVCIRRYIQENSPSPL